jgi:hypothetical protein
MYFSDQKRLLVSEILKIGVTKPFHRVELRIVVGKDFRFSLSMNFRGVPVHSTGLYAIYAEGTESDECLYVGESGHCVSQRVRKFFKELAECSHEDEDHAGARRARDNGQYTIESHNYKVKWVSWKEISRVAREKNINTDFRFLDEYVAHHLKSKYNSSTFLQHGYSGRTLEEFLEVA